MSPRQGLDPAGQIFQEDRLNAFMQSIGLFPKMPDRLDQSDARHVFAVHTTNFLGDERPIGHTDVYLGDKTNNALGSPKDLIGNFFAGAGNHQDGYNFLINVLKSGREALQNLLNSPNTIIVYP